jgi:hypothetical protein
MKRSHWLDRINRMDPETDYAEIYRISSAYEFPWDVNNALGLALYRTYAVPSIGRLLFETGEFTERTQKRYDDTALILAAVLENGFEAEEARAAIRRMNQMHRRYSITDDDFRYVLATFVVVPKRWLDRYGWRPYSEVELRASVNYYRRLGTFMNIPQVPETYREFERLLDDYEAEHFAYDDGARAVSDATLDLFSNWFPGPVSKALRAVGMCWLDEPLRRAFGYPPPNPRLDRAVQYAMRLRAGIERRMPPRRKPALVRDNSNIRSYPQGYRVDQLGTFAPNDPDAPAASACPYHAPNRAGADA